MITVTVTINWLTQQPFPAPFSLVPLSFQSESWILSVSASLEARGASVTQSGEDVGGLASLIRDGHGWHCPFPFLLATAAQMLCWCCGSHLVTMR